MKPQQPAKAHYKLETQQLLLKPYSRSYVAQYHNWFSLDPELLYLTGSEPLTLEQQLQNHKSWLEDPRKYTFIIFEKQGNKMIGDINLFFSEWIEPNESEINVMIALKEYRGKGYAKQAIEAVELFSYAIYARDTVIAKIKEDNIGSIKLFEKLEYTFVQKNSHYQEVEYRKQQKISKEQAATLLKSKHKLEQVTDIQPLYN